MPAQIINTPGTTPTSKVTSIAREVEAWCVAERGVQLHHFYGSTTWPDHANRRCLDIMIAGPVGQQPVWLRGSRAGKPLTYAEGVVLGDAIHDYLVANAKRHGSNGLIWDRKVTGFPHVASPPYRGPYGVARSYTGKSPHTDHNHLEVDGTDYVPPKGTKPPVTTQPAPAYATPKTRVVYVDRLAPGQKGSDSVFWVQTALGVPTTGTYDAKTVEAVEAFQKVLGDDVDGDLGPLQTAALFRLHDVLGVSIEAEA